MHFFSRFSRINNYNSTKRILYNLCVQKNKLVSSFTKINTVGDFYNAQLLKCKQWILQVHYASQKCTPVSKSEKNNILVYTAPLKTRIKIVKYLSLSSSMIGFAVFPTVIYDLSKLNVFVASAAGTVSLFFLSTPFMLHWITKRYVLELYFDDETKIFSAKTYNIINQVKEIKFKAEDVTVPDLPGMLSSFLVNGKPLFVDAGMIQDPDAYSHMMGYDKPFDITLNTNQQNENQKTT